MTYPTGPKTNYVAEGLARLLTQYKDKPFLAGIIQSWENRLQEAENAVWEVVLYRLIDNAEGAQLTSIGKIVGAVQGNLTDAAFRRELQAAILLLRAKGDPNTIQMIANLVLPPGCVYQYVDEAIGTIRIVLETVESFADISQAYRLLTRSRQGGVRFMLEFISLDSGADTTNIFTFRHYGSGAPYNAAHGFKHFGGTAEGRLRGVIATS